MAKPLPWDDMTVVRLEVDSFKRLRAAHVTPSPTGLVLVRGRNMQGKSALLESMIEALGGKAAASEMPIQTDAHGADVVVDLGELVVRKHWKRDSGGKAVSSLSIEGADGTPIKSPQAILDALVGRFADPVGFLALKPAEQVKTVLGVLGLDRQLQALEERAAAQFDERRDLGRDADRLTKAEAAMATEVEGLPAPPAEGTVDALTTALQAANEHNGVREQWVSERARAETAGRTATNRTGQLLTEIERREKELAGLREEVLQLQGSVSQERRAWAEANTTVLGMEVLDVEPLLEQLRQHEDAARFAGKRDLLEQTRLQAAEARAAHAAADGALESTRAEVAELLAGAEFPIPGMAYDPDKKLLTIGGIPFSQASQAQRIMVAAGVAMAGSPAIKVMFARDGSLLDDESRAQLAQLAEARGFQLWLEVVDSTRAGAGIWIEDGEAYEMAPDACARCGLPASVHGHGETGGEDSHPFESQQ